MNSIQSSTLRPGLLVSLKTSIAGNVHYTKRDIDPDHIDEGKRIAKWETERVITDPAEHELAVKMRTKVRVAITSVCASSAFGLLCPEADADKLDKAVAEAHRVADAFNAEAKLTRLFVYVIAGRIAPDDVEAVKAINSEIRDLMADMETGLKNLDVKSIRDAAGRARSLGMMLSPDANARVQIAIDTARSAAKRIVQAGEQAEIEVDNSSIRKIAEMRTAFLDLDEAGKIEAPKADGRALDLAPTEKVKPQKAKAAAFEVE